MLSVTVTRCLTTLTTFRSQFWMFLWREPFDCNERDKSTHILVPAVIWHHNSIHHTTSATGSSDHSTAGTDSAAAEPSPGSAVTADFGWHPDHPADHWTWRTDPADTSECCCDAWPTYTIFYINLVTFELNLRECHLLYSCWEHQNVIHCFGSRMQNFSFNEVSFLYCISETQKSLV